MPPHAAAADFLQAAKPDRLPQIEENLVYHLLRLVQWPSDKLPVSDRVFKIGMAVDNANVILRLVNIRAERIAKTPGSGPQGRDYRVLTAPTGRCATAEWADWARSLHLLYIDAQRVDDLRACLGAVSGKPVLTIGWGDGFVHDGGLVAFVPVGHHLRVHVALAATHAADLRMSAEILQHAEIVDSRHGKGAAQTKERE